MIKAIGDFVGRDLRPRWVRIVVSAHFLGAVTFTALFALGIIELPVEEQPASNLSGIAITYAAIAFGFSLSTALVLLTLPRLEFLLFLKSEQGATSDSNALEDLLFIFVWTGILHWGLIAMTILLWSASEPGAPLLASTSSWLDRLLVGGWMGVGIYALAQFLVSIITLQQLGRVYVTQGLERRP